MPFGVFQSGHCTSPLPCFLKPHGVLRNSNCSFKVL
jgi:hypothetical protein